MKSIQIKDSYTIWSPLRMRFRISALCMLRYDNSNAEVVLHRSYLSMYIEWWLHNIGYYLTRNIALFKSINERCKDVDLEEHL